MKSYLRCLSKNNNSLLLGDLLTSCLLPLVLLTSLLSTADASPLYSNLCRASIGLGLSAWLMFITDLASDNSSPPGNISLPHFGIAALTLFLFPPGSPYNTYTIYWAIICLRPLLLWLVTMFPHSFSFGEAALLCQSVMLVSASLLLKLVSHDQIVIKLVITEIAQTLKWTADYCLNSLGTILLLLMFWSLLVILSVGVVGIYNRKGWTVNTKTRKLFHLSVVLVYVSGLLFSPFLLYISSIAALVLMVSIEAVRWSQVFPPVSDYLNHVLKPFLDTKDSGSLILTNIYLLVGVSWPLWVYPGSLTAQPAPLVLYCGVISVGIADSAASVVGSSVGHTRWAGGSHKTVEGSVAAFVSSLVFVYFLSQVWAVHVGSWTALVLALLGMVLTEAFSQQVDNLTLPLVMHGLLAFAQYKQF